MQCIREARFKKTSEGLRSIDGNPLKVNLLSFMEINEIRPFLLKALDKAARLSLLEATERMAKLPKDVYPIDAPMDSSQLPTGAPYSSTDYNNPYSEMFNPGSTYNPYAFSTTSQQ